MSSLWGSFTNRIIKIKSPSPAKSNVLFDIAQNRCRAIKRVSLFASFRKKIGKEMRKEVCAGMTVEAAMVLPLFLFFFLNLGSVMEIIRLHGNLELALWETGSTLSVYGHVLDKCDDLTDSQKEEMTAVKEETDSWWMELSGLALSYTYVKSQMIDYLGEAYWESSPLTYGTAGLEFWEGSIWETEGKYELLVTYSVSPFSRISGFGSFRMANRYYGHLWNGYHIPGTEAVAAEQQVYITETGTVYHTYANCTHLQLSIKKVSRQEALASRNYQGGRYAPCEKCSRFAGFGDVYITNEGDRYHFERECPGLKRTVYCVPVSQVSKLRACKRCASKGM